LANDIDLKIEAQNTAPSGGGFLKMPKIGGPISEDVRMTLNAFNQLINEMITITGNLCPQSGKMSNPFNNLIMPILSCPGSKITVGGRRKQNTHKYKKRNSKRHKSRKNKTRRR
jgi:hypothetical protein